MKRILMHIISLMFAAYFFVAGLGFNIIDYCCSSCREAGIEFIAANSCFDVHNQKRDTCCSTEHHDEDYSVSITHSHEDHCSINSFYVETPVVSSTSQMFSAPIFKLVVALVEVKELFVETSVTENFYLKYPPPLLTSSGRNILSQKSVLII